MTDGGARRRLRRLLIVSEVAMAMVLLIGAGLLLRSFDRLIKVDPGFASEKVVALQVFIWGRARTPEQRAAYARQAVEKLETVPGVKAAGITTALPFLGSSTDTSYPFTIDGRPAPPVGQEPTLFSTIVTEHYFTVMGVPLLRGRVLNQFDTAESQPVAVINESVARRYWPHEDPVGQKITVRFTGRGGAQPKSLEIVGVTGDVRNDGLDKEPRPEFFQPHTQSPSGSIIFVVRTAADPVNIIPALKARLWEISAAQPFYIVSTVDALISDSLRARRFSLVLLSSFALLAMVLALVGIYGVMNFATSQRTHEIGVRVALGAQTRDVLKLVLGEGLMMASLGVVLGLAASAALTRLMASLLFGVSATDPATFAAVTLLLLSVALLACYLPARRATKVDPLAALRYE